MKRKCINSDGEQFHQCLLNKQSPLTSSHRTKKKDNNILHWKSRSWFGTDIKQEYT
jgi:hypothetical protein